ncbi:MAG TPA: matrixin family metalloprotease [Candidatus Limnocylindrales bacterium]|nr:matrixin family metalloprotease [Candidatus Limnocylindrales bacterium]
MRPVASATPATIAGPPFAGPQPGVPVVDEADVFSAETEGVAAALIGEISSRHDISLVVYSQFKPGSTHFSTERDAVALKLQWRLVNAVVIMWNTTSPECVAGESGNGQVQIYADTRLSAARLSELKRQKIFDDLMMPSLLACDEDNALLLGLNGIEGEIRAPRPTPDSSDSPTLAGACNDNAYQLADFHWDSSYEWVFNEQSVPEGMRSNDVLDVLIQSAENITSARNDCGLPDRVDATARFAGSVAREPCVAEEADGFNTVGFGELPDDQDADTLAFVCTYGGRNVVVEADMLINSAIPWALAKGECAGFMELLEPTITHEFGHVFGLSHVSEEEHGDLTMSPTSNGPCDAEETSLGLGDVLGLEELY